MKMVLKTLSAVAVVSLILTAPTASAAPASCSCLSQTVAFMDGDVRLEGTFSVPEGKGRFPAIILLAGSGPNNRDEIAVWPGQPPQGFGKFAVLSTALTQAGFAVFRYDKRGIAGSGGDYNSATFDSFTSDALAALAWLRTRAEVDRNHIGLVGDSEGGSVATVITARDAGLHELVLLSTPALPYEQVSLLQHAAMARAEGRSSADIAADEALYHQVYEVVRTSPSADAARAQLEAMAPPLVAAGRLSQAQADAGIAGVTTPFVFGMMGFDPAPYLRQVHVPVLVIQGALDTQVPATENLSAMRSTLHGPDVDIAEMAGINHQLQAAMTGAPSEYERLEQTVDPAVMTKVLDWLQSHGR